MKTIARVLPFIFSLLLIACGGDGDVVIPQPTGSFADSEIYPTIKAVEDSNGVVLTTAVLRAGIDPSSTPLYLSSGDKLYASLGTPPEQLLSFSDDLFNNSLTLSTRLKLMKQRSQVNHYYLFSRVITGTPEYFATDSSNGLSRPLQAYVGFERGDMQWAGSASVQMPMTFSVLAPTFASSHSRAEPLTLTWSDVDPNSTMRLSVGGVCGEETFTIDGIELGADTTGTHVLDANDYFPDAMPLDASCQLAFILNRVGQTQIAYFGLAGIGSFQGRQERTVIFTTTP